MRLGWDEIKRRARRFSEEWCDAHYEKGETQSFYNAFFHIFGVDRRQVARYEQRVQLLGKKHGFMDLFWPRVLLIEQKSAGLDLDRAGLQALDYIDGIAPAEQPRHVLTCDFQSWRLKDYETGAEIRFKLADLHKHVEAFDFILGRRRSFETAATVTIQAAELMGKLHDALEESRYTGHDLEQLLVRLLFCMFADRTGIFQPMSIFLQLLQNETRADGSDTGPKLMELFDVLDTHEDDRQSNLSGELNAFPYINGELFTRRLRTPVFDATMRGLLLNACEHDWSGVSPAIFGSLFQSVMNAKERRAKGAHYTSEANIMKVIGPLFLDDLRAELDRLVARRTGRAAALIEFQNKLSRLKFLDPACGCGNFLVIAYREIRRLELACLKALYPAQAIDAVLLSRVTVEQFHGIEIEEFPARIAEVAMWMTDHLANNESNEAFKGNSARIPLRASAHILHADALDTDWNDVLPAADCHYLMGNPPFIGFVRRGVDQKEQATRIFAQYGAAGARLDYVAAWFLKAAEYTQARRTPFAFVATSSICQGEQVAQLWPALFTRWQLEIAFAHRPFKWQSEAAGAASVDVVIVGLAHADREPPFKRLFSYHQFRGDPVESQHGALTAYLFDARTVQDRHLVIKRTSTPLQGAPIMRVGTKPVDGGHYILDAKERSQFLLAAPQLAPLVRPFLGTTELTFGKQRWIINAPAATPNEIAGNRVLRERVEAVAKSRKGSGPLAQ